MEPYDFCVEYLDIGVVVVEGESAEIPCLASSCLNAVRSFADLFCLVSISASLVTLRMSTAVIHF